MIRFWEIRSPMCDLNSFRGQNPPLSLPVYAWPQSLALVMDSAVIRTVLAPRKSTRLAAGTSVADPPVAAGEDRLLETGLPGCPYIFLESGDIWLTATSSSLSGVRGSSGVGPTAGLRHAHCFLPLGTCAVVVLPGHVVYSMERDCSRLH